MALIDRLFHEPTIDSSLHIPNHAFSALVWFAATGRITRAQLVSILNLSVEDEIQLDEFIVYYGTLTIVDQNKFHNDVEAAGMLAELGFITQAQYKNLFNLS